MKKNLKLSRNNTIPPTVMMKPVDCLFCAPYERFSFVVWSGLGIVSENLKSFGVKKKK